MRRHLAILALAVAPALTAAVVVRPAAGQSEGDERTDLTRYALTFTAAPISTEGGVGASGGLVVFDLGVPYASGRLDSSPSSAAVAAAAEPGGLVRTGTGQVNTEAGEEVISVPTAEANSPGEPEGVSEVVAPVSAGPVTLGPGRAEAHAGPKAASGEGRIDAVRLSPAEGEPAFLVAGDAVGSGTLDAEQDLVALAEVTTARVTVAGVVVIEGITGRAEVSDGPGDPTSDATLNLGRVTVGGVPVEVSPGGVETLTGGPLTARQVEDTLEQAGVRLAIAEPVEWSDGSSAYADSGGLRVTLETPTTPEVPGNSLTVVFGRAVVTVSSEPALAAVPPGAIPPVGVARALGETFSGSDAVAPPPAEAQRAPVAERVTAGRILVAGKSLPAVAVLAGFGAWQLLSLGLATLAAVWTRKEDDELDDLAGDAA